MLANARFQPRRLMIAPAAAGCKRMLDRTLRSSGVMMGGRIDLANIILG